jgi:hypothetical protein
VPRADGTLGISRRARACQINMTRSESGLTELGAEPATSMPVGLADVSTSRCSDRGLLTPVAIIIASSRQLTLFYRPKSMVFPLHHKKRASCARKGPTCMQGSHESLNGLKRSRQRKHGKLFTLFKQQRPAVVLARYLPAGLHECIRVAPALT